MKDRIKKLRKELGLTQQEFADKLGVARNNIAGYEAGNRNPSDAAISLICTKCNVNESWLRTGEGNIFPPIDRQTEIARLTKQLLNEDEDSFKNRLISVLANLSEDQWSLLAEIAEKNEWSYLSTTYNSVTMIQNIAMEYYQQAQWFYKLDEDIFLTEGTLESMMRTFITVPKLEPCNVGVVAPLIPLNGYGYIKILDKLGLRDRYEDRFDKVLSGGYPAKKIESDVEAAAFMWGATGEVPRLDELNRKFGGSHKYSFCNVRFSIGCILYNRAFWDKMGNAYPYGTSQPGDVGEDEVHLCARTVLKSHVLVIDENSVVGHFSFVA